MSYLPMTAVTRRVPAARLTSVADFLALRVRDLWRFFRTQGLAYQAMCLYLIVEYVRPQQLFGWIYGLPLGQITLGVALLAYLWSGKWFGMKSIGSWLLLLFTVVIIASSVAAFDSSTSFDALRVWISWVVIYFLIINVVNTEQRFAFFILLWLLCHYYMSQGGAKQFAFRGFQFASWGIQGAPGWFANSGEFGIAMCMLLPVSWHFYVAAKTHLSKWRKVFMLGMPVTALLCIIGSSSRGAVVGLGAIGVWALLRSKQHVRTLVGVAALAAAAWYILPPEQKARFSEAGTDDTSVSRRLYWERGLEMAREHPLLGIGYENWLKYYAAHYADSRLTQVYGVQVSHNIFIQCMAELGYTGLMVFVLLIVATFVINYRTRRAVRAGTDPPDMLILQMAYGLDGALVGYLAAGFFVTVLYYPFFWINLALSVALGAIARHRQEGQLPGNRAPGNLRRGLVRGAIVPS
jgi:O-antigen ligase